MSESYAEWRKAHRKTNPHVADPTYMKEVYKTIRAESSRMCDTAAKREDVKQVLFLALTQKDVDNLHTLAAASPRTKNYAVLVRRLIAHTAKSL